MRYTALRNRLGTAVLILCTLALPVRAADAPDQELLVFAAASLTNSLDEIGTAYTQKTQHVKFSYAASSALARQLEAGSRADVFVSADLEWMDYVQARNLIDRSTRQNLLSNRLVLVAPADSKIELKIAPGFALATALGSNGRLATGDPESVPVGKYARSALTSLGVWNDVADRLVRADNVRSALAFIARGETPLGIVYETDAKVEKRVRIVDYFPASSHPPIVYPVAATAPARPAAKQFVEFLQSAPAQEIFRKYGFQTSPSR